MPTGHQEFDILIESSQPRSEETVAMESDKSATSQLWGWRDFLIHLLFGDVQ